MATTPGLEGGEGREDWKLLLESTIYVSVGLGTKIVWAAMERGVFNITRTFGALRAPYSGGGEG